MALVTSMLSGPLMQHFLGHKRRVRFTQFLTGKSFVPALRATDASSAIAELAAMAAAATGLSESDITHAVVVRERMMATGIEAGVAVPHAHVRGLIHPVIAIGLSDSGLDFGTLDGSRARIIVLALTPVGADDQQLEMLADIAATLSDSQVREDILRAASYAELKSALGAADDAPAHRSSEPDGFTPWLERVSVKPSSTPPS